MNEMLANRYLLNGKAAQALECYRKALAAFPEQSTLKCRMILAHLETSDVNDAANFLLGMFDQLGIKAIEELHKGCRGFVPTDVPEDHEAVKGLRAILSGNLRRAAKILAGVDSNEFPAVARLAARLREIDHGT